MFEPRPWSGLKLVAIANMKGGVGKSTTTMMIADTLALHHGLRVLVVDLDAQSNVSRMMLGFQGLKNAKASRRTLTDWLDTDGEEPPPPLIDIVNANVCGLKEVADLRRTSAAARCGDVSVVAATPELRFAELAFDHAAYQEDDIGAPRKRMMEVFQVAFLPLREAYDVVLFDCPPSFTTLAQACISMSDAVVSPLFEDPLSAWSLQAFRDFGLKKTLNIWDPSRHRGLYTRVKSQGAVEERREVREAVSKINFKMFSTSIRESAEAHRWVRRPGLDSFTSFGRKYGRERENIRTLGDEMVSFVKGIQPRKES